MMQLAKTLAKLSLLGVHEQFPTSDDCDPRDYLSQTVSENTTIYLRLKDVIDVEKELQRLNKKRDKFYKQIHKINNRKVHQKLKDAKPATEEETLLRKEA